ncbi:helix-turn-helix domain-containing protein [Cetobacterium sp. ZWU0022]|uniref:helix-turn-helix domain-containing protein n=1 Tax=Cetobacterium sp. ZWU0022 TaxID=1340502 RepID=UPI000645F492|nr:helix-turn-helix domain-containing protein [Cetobacterium sp. ZWU0022]
MFLNKKSLYILSLFFSLNRFSYSDLEKILHIKKRSIDNNINIINDFLASYKIQGIQKMKDLFFLRPCTISRIKEILQFAPLSVTERKEYLLLQLFFENTINLNDNTDKIQTTRRTLNYDLKDIKEYLESKNLKIDSVSGKGIFLDGDERVIRELFSIHLTKYLINKNINHNLFTDLINNYFHEDTIEFNKNFVLRLLNGISVTLVTEDFYKIVAILLINPLRENKSTFENEYIPKEKVISHKFYGKTAKFLKARGLDYLKPYELDSIIETLFYLDTKSYDELDELTSKLIKEIDRVFNIDLTQNFQTVMRVSNLLRIGKLKSEYNFYENKEVYGLNKHQKEEYKKIEDILTSLSLNFYSEDIIYLGIVLKNHYENSQVDRTKHKRVVIVDDTFDHMYGSLLSKYLKNFSFIEVVKIIESYEINSLLEDLFEVDYLITIDDLQNLKLNIPLVKINREHFLDNTFDLSQLSLILK